MSQTISIPLGEGSIQLPASIIIKKALEHAFCGASVAQGTPALGEYWEGEGGANGGLFQGGERPYYLIVGVGSDAEFKGAYGGYEHKTTGADSSWDGQANTRALLEDGVDHPIAQLVAEYQKDGHSDFYLPARRELQVLEVNVPQLFSKARHWSSSQYSADSAYYMGFEIGWQFISDKYYEWLGRPVRRKFL